jgi:co-chaperonin GroES (HSP10)
VRPEKTKSGLYLTDANRDEDKIQGKVGLLVKLGPIAFDDMSGQWFQGVDVDLNDWIVFRPSDGWSVTVNGVLCRMIEDVNVRGKIPHPDMVW